MAIPVLETGWTSATSGGATVSSLTLNMPTGITSGDLLLLIVGDDANGDTNLWNTTTTGVSFDGSTDNIVAGDSESDAHMRVLKRVADGTEGSTVTINHSGVLDELYGWVLRISGADTTTPIHASLATEGSTGSTYTIDGVTTATSDCLIIAGMAEDGGDGGTFTIDTGAGWSIVDQQNSGTGSADAAGLIAQRDQATGGAGVDLLIDSGEPDGKAGFQIAIQKATEVDTEVDLAATSYTLTGNATETITMDRFTYPDAASFTLTGYTSTVSKGYQVPVALDAGSFSLTGYATENIDVNRPVALDAGSFSLTGYTTTVSRGVPVALDAGSFSLTGYTTTVSRGVPVALDAGSFSLTGYTSTVSKGYQVPVALDAGSFSLTGYATENIDVNRPVALDAGSFSLTGYTTTVSRGVPVALDAGSYTLIGYTSTVSRGLQSALDTGSFTLTGQDTTLSEGVVAALDAGVFVLTGQDTTLSEGVVAALDAGVFVLTGNTLHLDTGWRAITPTQDPTWIEEDTGVEETWTEEVPTNTAGWS